MPEPLTTINLAKVLKQEHPDVCRMRSKWDLYLECYEGDEMQKYLHQHLRENLTNFQKRQLRVYYYNYCCSVIDTYVAYIFRRPIVRALKVEEVVPSSLLPPLEGVPFPEEEAPEDLETDVEESVPEEEVPFEESAPEEEPVEEVPEEAPVPESPEDEESQVQEVEEALRRVRLEMEDEDFKRFHEDVDGAGTHINDWMKTTSRLAEVFGFVGVVVDMPPPPTTPEGEEIEVATEQQREDTGLFPYLTRVFPSSLSNWAVDDQGRLLWLRYREDPPPQADPLSEVKRSKSSYYRTWTKDHWFLHEVSGTTASLVAEGDHPVGRVPVVFVYSKRSLKNPLIGVSALASISQINVGLLNWCSLIDEHLYQKCLSILTIKKRLEDTEEVTIGNNNVLEFEGDIAPSFIAPPAEPEQFILEMIRKAIEEIYRIARLGGALGLQSKEAQSGVAYAFEFNETNAMLAEKADNLEQGEKEIHYCVGKWLGKDEELLENIVIDYPEDFGVDDVNAEVGTLQTIQQVMTSKTFKQEVEKRLVKQILPKMDVATHQKILAEITLGEPAPPPAFPGMEGEAVPVGPAGDVGEPVVGATTGEELPPEGVT